VFLPATYDCFFTPAFTVATADGEPIAQPEDPSRLCASIIDYPTQTTAEITIVDP
jgi:hypothetical protein